MLLGEKMPDRNDPKYKERYERDVEAGRKFAKATRIDKAAAKVQGFANVHRTLFLVIVFAFVAAGLAAGAIRAFHEAGLWNHFQEIAFDMSAVLSTHSLFGTLMEGIFGYQEAPSVSEVAVWFIYLIPALVAFALPPRAGATASRSA